MYFLRKHLQKSVSEVNTSQSSNKCIEDLALYRSTVNKRLYMLTYKKDITMEGVRLWTCKTLQRALEKRIELFLLYKEWFDVYHVETQTKIDSMKYTMYKPRKLDIARARVTLYYNWVTNKIETTRPRDLENYTIYRKGTRFHVYNFRDYHSLWDYCENEDLCNKILVVDKDNNTLVEFSSWEEYTLIGSTLIKTSWEHKNTTT